MVLGRSVFSLSEALQEGSAFEAHYEREGIPIDLDEHTHEHGYFSDLYLGWLLERLQIHEPHWPRFNMRPISPMQLHMIEHPQVLGILVHSGEEGLEELQGHWYAIAKCDGICYKLDSLKAREQGGVLMITDCNEALPPDGRPFKLIAVEMEADAATLLLPFEVHEVPHQLSDACRFSG